MSDVFISYARSAASEAHAVAEALRALGYSVWRDDDLPAHKPYAEVIGERLAAAKAVVVIWTAEAAKSQWVFSEANRAREDGKLVQLSLEAVRLPMPFDAIQCADLAGWSGDLQAHGWLKVVASIGDLVSGSRSAAPASATAAPRRRSICVLPFANMSGDPEQAYFSDGISEDVITDLSKVSALFVVARNTAFTFKGKSVDVAEVAARLNVSHVLEGSVRKAGNRVRITAQLIDGATGGHVWAERYDRELDDIFALQDEISSAILVALKLKMLPQEKQAIERRGTDSAEAYDLYLMARSYHLNGSNGDRRTYEAMERLCRRAVEIDPDYAQAWALMATGQFNLRRVQERPDEESDTALERALALNPDLAEARALRARLLSSAGRQEEAAAEIAVALRLDPESYEVNIFAANISYTQGRLAEATPFYEKVITLVETDLSAPHMLISCYTALGDEENVQRVAKIALERAEKALVQDPSNSNAMETGVTALAAQGERARSQDWMRRALLVDPDNLQMRYNFACALAIYLGDVEAALDMLRPALERDNAGVLVRNARADPDFACLQGNPRFEAMLAAAGARLATTRSANEAGRTA